MNQKVQGNSYLIINLIFAGVIIAILVYSFLFSTEGQKHPVPSATEWFSENPVPSTGLSRSFSEIVRFNFGEARHYNRYGIRVFLFFLIQLVLRVAVSGFVMYGDSRHIKSIITMDVLLSGSLFIVCFWPFLVFLIREYIP